MGEKDRRVLNFKPKNNQETLRVLSPFPQMYKYYIIITNTILYYLLCGYKKRAI